MTASYAVDAPTTLPVAESITTKDKPLFMNSWLPPAKVIIDVVLCSFLFTCSQLLLMIFPLMWLIRSLPPAPQPAGEAIEALWSSSEILFRVLFRTSSAIF